MDGGRGGGGGRGGEREDGILTEGKEREREGEGGRERRVRARGERGEKRGRERRESWEEKRKEELAERERRREFWRHSVQTFLSPRLFIISLRLPPRVQTKNNDGSSSRRERERGDINSCGCSRMSESVRNRCECRPLTLSKNRCDPQISLVGEGHLALTLVPIQ
eukprot:scaffold189849_cov29-Tisochrysis_lutea.AAC.2